MSNVFKSSWITTADFADRIPDDVIFKPIGTTVEGDIFNYHICFKKNFSYNGGKVTINISADDYYKLYINGCFVGQGPAPAYFYDYKSNTYDITPHLKSGVNTVAVHTYYDGNVNRVWNSGDNRFGLVADLYCDGEIIFGTDEGWKYKRLREFTSQQTVGYKTSYLDDIDLRLRDKEIFSEVFVGDWNESVAVSPDYTFCTTAEPSLQVYRVEPRIREYRGDGWFLDFGKEYAAGLCLTLSGDSGEEVKILSAEELCEDGTLPEEMRCNCKYTETVTLSGGEEQVATFGYKGFRYAKITCRRDALKEVYMVAQNHAFDDSASAFTCGNKLLEDIFHLCKHTLKVGTQEGILDCIQREKGQYLGDFTVSGLSYLYLTGDTHFYRKVLLDFAATSRINKGLLAVAPGSLRQEIADFSLQYPLQVMNYYKYTGDGETVKALLPVIDGILEHFGAFERPDGLLQGVTDKWNLVDWPDNLRDDYDCQLPLSTGPDIAHNVLNAFYVGAYKVTEELKAAVGMEFTSRFETLKQSFQAAFFDESTGLFKDTEESKHHSLHSNAVAAYYGLAPESSRSKIAEHIRAKGLCCGVQMSYFVLKALGILGDYEGERQLLLNETDHSWANMLREGATTTFEAWGKDQKFNTSLCHPWATAPIIIIAEDLEKIINGVSYSLKLPHKTIVSE